MILGVRASQVGSQNQTTIEQKIKPIWESVLIFERFLSILGSKLRSKVEQTSIQKGTENVIRKRKSPKKFRVNLVMVKLVE